MKVSIAVVSANSNDFVELLDPHRIDSHRIDPNRLDSNRKVVDPGSMKIAQIKATLKTDASQQKRPHT